MPKNKKTGIYIHVPFCKKKCLYCDFHSHPESENTVDSYISAIIYELKTRERLSLYAKGDLFADTVYFGGGTPSLLPIDSFQEIMNAIRENIRLSNDCEITVECNPSSSSDRLFNAYKKAGVNRISLGLQSVITRERKALGRHGTADDVSNAITSCKNSGIDNISLDIMIGIPEQTEKSLLETITFCAESGAKHISAYMLKIEKNTPFHHMRNQLNLPDEDFICSLYESCCEKLGEYGFEQYEISNFAKDGFFSRHNLKYWKLDDYIGIGPSAHSFFDGKRFYFLSDTESFINGEKPVYDDLGGGLDEYIMLSLRLVDGINFKEMGDKYGYDEVEKIKEKARPFIGWRLAEIKDNRLCLTRKGFLLSNTVIAALID